MAGFRCNGVLFLYVVTTVGLLAAPASGQDGGARTGTAQQPQPPAQQTADTASYGYGGSRYDHHHMGNNFWELLLLNPHGKDTPAPAPTPTPKPSCFTADTRLVVKGDASPVTIRELRVGQHVMCFEAGADMMAPGAPAWCEVKNFAHAADGSFPDGTRLIYRAHDGALATSTVADLHMMQVLTDATPKGEAAAPRELGELSYKFAKDVQPGDLLPVATSRDLNTTFRPAVVEGVERMTAVGKYIPAIEMPFVLADGVVAPLWSTWQYNADGVLTIPTEVHAANAIRHMLFAPLWMTNVQPKGTPGQHAQWDGKPRPALTQTLVASFSGKAVSGTANLTRTQEWFAPRYQAWKADPSKAITEADVLEVWPSLFDGVRGVAIEGDGEHERPKHVGKAQAVQCGLSVPDRACVAATHSM